VVAAMDPYLGRYFSAEYVRREILGQSDSEMLEIDKQMKKEIKDGIIPDPAAMMQPEMGAPMQQGDIGTDALGAPMKEPGVSDSNVQAGEI